MFNSRPGIFKVIRIIIDCINMILGVGVVALAIFTFIDAKKNEEMFPIIFLGGAGMNLFTGIKFMMTDRKVAGIMTFVAACALAGIAYFTFKAIGGN